MNMPGDANFLANMLAVLRHKAMRLILGLEAGDDAEASRDVADN